MGVFIVIVGSEALQTEHVDNLVNLLDMTRDSVKWLSPDIAFEISMDNVPPSLFLRVREYTDSICADLFSVSSENRKKKLFVADMDSTILVEESMDEMAGELSQDIKDKIEAITERSMRGELDFHESIRERVGMLKGLPETAITKTIDNLTYTGGAVTLVKTMRAHGVICALVTGGFTQFAEWAGETCGFNHTYSNTLGIEDGILTGEVLGDILDKHLKRQILEDLAQENNIGIVDTMAIGDGANDMLMIEKSGHGVGFNPKPVLAEVSDSIIRYTDLKTVLYIQGYSDNDFS